MASKQRHDLGWQKRQAARPYMEAAKERRAKVKARRLTVSVSLWFEAWLRSEPGKGYRPYNYGE